MKISTAMRNAFLVAAHKAQLNGEAKNLADTVFTEAKRGSGSRRVRKGWRVLRGNAAPKEAEE